MRNKPDQPQTQMTINQLRFDEFVELQNLKKRSARDAYLEKSNYIQEEIQRMEENDNYESELMKKSERKAKRRRDQANRTIQNRVSLPFINISSVGTDIPELKTTAGTERTL